VPTAPGIAKEKPLKRECLVKDFSKRLTDIMQLKGYHSLRSKAGVTISELTKICGCSHQMARRYVLGDALPDIEITIKIAKWLDVSPGWLLFGEESNIPNNIDKNNLIHIESDLLQYILLQSAQLFLLTQDTKEVVSFIMDIINDTTHIDADKKAILKIVDISVNSVTRFSGSSNGKESSIA
jgi:transcriptional regulator with XRE-family HTH domain